MIEDWFSAPGSRDRGPTCFLCDLAWHKQHCHAVVEFRRSLIGRLYNILHLLDAGWANGPLMACAPMPCLTLAAQCMQLVAIGRPGIDSRQANVRWVPIGQLVSNPRASKIPYPSEILHHILLSRYTPQIAVRAMRCRQISPSPSTPQDTVAIRTRTAGMSMFYERNTGIL